jgi:hypothetical protein
VRTLTPDVLACDHSTITAREPRSREKWIILGTGDMRGAISPRTDPVSALAEHVSIQFFSIAKMS